MTIANLSRSSSICSVQAVPYADAHADANGGFEANADGDADAAGNAGVDAGSDAGTDADADADAKVSLLSCRLCHSCYPSLPLFTDSDPG